MDVVHEDLNLAAHVSSAVLRQMHEEVAVLDALVNREPGLVAMLEGHGEAQLLDVKSLRPVAVVDLKHGNDAIHGVAMKGVCRPGVTVATSTEP